jgi:hypothetical protein
MYLHGGYGVSVKGYNILDLMVVIFLYSRNAIFR